MGDHVSGDKTDRGIGFIGLGNIGRPIARHLLKLGQPVWVRDVEVGPVMELVGLGAKRADTPAELARQCHHIGICVRDDIDVEQLLYGSAGSGRGLFEEAETGTVIAVHSTVSYDAMMRWSRHATLRGIHLVDAPITGGAGGADAATLCYMIGGDAALFERCRPIFATSGNKLVHAGATGAGITLKLCNNIMTYAAFAAIDEASRLAKAGGLDAALLLEVGRSNGVVTPQMEAFFTNRERMRAVGPEVLEQGFGPFGALGRKDLAAALESARKLGVDLAASERVHEIIQDVFLAKR
ncbi:MAG TPA: NAD(P)-dependent oxidoreductase [Solimonas sp.]|nr:NAD(P)-dependent oxidoreductase [Solimonas sp.]